MAELEIGQHCDVEHCGQLDFLPYVCDGCSRVFCLTHRSRESHGCIEVHTSGNGGQSEGSALYPCSYKGCSGKELVQVICFFCEKHFCFRHRHQSDHECEKLDAPKARMSATQQLVKDIVAQDLQGRWKNVPDCYRRELEKQDKESGTAASNRKNYIYHQQPQFMYTTLRTNRISENVADPENSSDGMVSDTVQSLTPEQQTSVLDADETREQRRPAENPGKRKRAGKKGASATTNAETGILKMMESYEKQKQQLCNDEDLNFFLSVMPYVKSVPKEKRIDMQMELLQVFKKYANHEQESTNPCSSMQPHSHVQTPPYLPNEASPYRQTQTLPYTSTQTPVSQSSTFAYSNAPHAHYHQQPRHFSQHPAYSHFPSTTYSQTQPSGNYHPFFTTSVSQMQTLPQTSSVIQTQNSRLPASQSSEFGHNQTIIYTGARSSPYQRPQMQDRSDFQEEESSNSKM